MFLQVEIPAKYTIMENPNDTTVIEEGVIGTGKNDYTLFSLRSLQTPWTQYDKTNKFLFVPDEDANSIPAFSTHPKLRMKSVPDMLNLLDESIGFQYQNTWNKKVPSKEDQENAKQILSKAKTHITDFYNKYTNVRQKGVRDFMGWAEQQDDIFGFENTMFLSKDSLWDNLMQSYQFDPSSVFFGVNRTSTGGYDADGMNDGDPDDTKIEYVEYYNNALQVRCKQRMLADAPYNLKTAKFDPNMVYPVSMKYRYRSDYLEDAANLRHPDATPVSSGKKSSYYASDYNAQYKPPLLDWESLGFPKIAQTKSQSFIRRKPILIDQSCQLAGFVTDEGGEKMENIFSQSLLSLDEMFSVNNFVTDYDAYYGDFIPTHQLSKLMAAKLYVLSDFNRTYVGDIYTPIDLEDPERGVQGSKVEVENYGYIYSGYGCEIFASMEGGSQHHNPQKVSDSGESYPIEHRNDVYLVRKRGTGGVKPFLAEDGYPMEELKTMPTTRKIKVFTHLGQNVCNKQTATATRPDYQNYAQHGVIVQTDPSVWMETMGITPQSEALKRMFMVDTLTTGRKSLVRDIIVLLDKISKNLEVEEDDEYFSFTLEDIVYENMLAFKLRITRYNVSLHDETQVTDKAVETTEIIGVPHSDLLGFSIFQTGNILFTVSMSNYSGGSVYIRNDLPLIDMELNDLRMGGDPAQHISATSTSGPNMLAKIGYKDSADMSNRIREWINNTAYGQAYAQIQHQRKGLTISDALTLPIEERKNRITAKKKFSYTVPFPSAGVVKTSDDEGNDIPINQDVDYIQSDYRQRSQGFTVGTVITYNPAQVDSISEVTDVGVKLCGKQSYMNKMWVDSVEPPHYVYKIMKTNARHLKYTRDKKQYGRGGRPQDYTIFTDVLLPWTPLVISRNDEDADPTTKFSVEEIMRYGQECRFTEKTYGAYNYEPKRNRGQRLPDNFGLWMDGVPAEWCPETYSFYGRSYGILNWWGSLT